MASDLISRMAAIEHMKSMAGCDACNNYNEVRCRACTWDDAMNIVDELPAVDAAPVVHGRFIGTEYDGYADGNPVFYEWQCSACGCVFEDNEPTYNYCPNCGAKIDGGDSDEQANP